MTDSIKNVEAEQQSLPSLVNVFFYKMSSDLMLSVLLLAMLHVQAAKPRSAISPILYIHLFIIKSYIEYNTNSKKEK